MSMNFKKVESYLNQKAEEYRKYYPEEIFTDLKIGVCSGSFGSCLISLKNNFISFDCVYVGNYAAINKKVSEFFTSSYNRIASKVFEDEQKENKKGMKYTLEVFNDGELVNTIESANAREVKAELLKIIMAEKRRGIKTQWKPIPYSNNLVIIQKWEKEAYHLTHNTKYVYRFENIDY